MERVTIGVPAARRAGIEAFLREEGIGWALAVEAAGDLTILDGAEPGRACDRRTLYAGGRIDCATALALAEAAGVPSAAVGRLLDLLEIRIRNCQLGCFG